MDDAQLVAAALRGDLSAFEKLVCAHQRLVMASAFQIVHHQADAEDLAQDTFLEAYRDLRKLREPGKFRAWLFAILRHNCYRYLQRRHPEELSLDDIAETPAAPEPFVADLALAEHLAMLPLQYREVLLARYLHELSYREIGETLQISELAARVRCARARAQLRAIITQAEEEERSLRKAMAGLAVGVSSQFTARVLQQVGTMAPAPAPAPPPISPAPAQWAGWHGLAHVAAWKVAVTLAGALLILSGGAMLLQRAYHHLPAVHAGMALPPTHVTIAPPATPKVATAPTRQYKVLAKTAVATAAPKTPVHAGRKLALLLPSTQHPAPPAPAALTSIFTTANMPPMREVADEKALLLDWFAVPVTKGGGMFNPVFIPFQYRAQGVAADKNQPLTFPSLLNFKFGLVLDNFYSRSPAFIFRQDNIAVKLGVTDAKAIAAYIKRWSATHAIGGSITATADGYSGELLVFNAAGARVLRKTYVAPQPYFTLMGHMVEDWMDYRHQPHSPALQAELERPMTTKMETVAWYGESFQQPWRTPREWAVYQRILEADPDFSEVRYWYANQRSWQDGFTPELRREKARAFISHVIPAAMQEYDPQKITDEELREQADAAIERALTLIPEHNMLLNAKYFAYGYLNMPEKAVGQLLPFAQRYPCSWPMLHMLSIFYVGMQPEKGIPLALSAAHSGWPRANTDMWAAQSDWLRDTRMYDDYFLAASGFWHTGHGQTANYCLRQALCSVSTDEQRIGILKALINLRRDFLAFRDASDLANRSYLQAGKMTELTYDGNKQEILLCAYLAAYESGQLERAHELEIDVSTLPERYTKIWKQRRAVSHGKFTDAAASELGTGYGCMTPEFGYDPGREQTILHVEAALLAGLPNAERDARRAWLAAPLAPRSGYLLEQASLKKHPQELLRYAEVMHWLAPEEPYWPILRQRALRAGAADDTATEISALIIEWNGKAGTMPLAPPGSTEFWLDAPPFLPEYLLMKAIAGNDHAQIAAAMAIYVKYHTAAINYPGLFDVHLRVFYLKVIRLLPADIAAQMAAQLRWAIHSEL